MFIIYINIKYKVWHFKGLKHVVFISTGLYRLSFQILGINVYLHDLSFHFGSTHAYIQRNSIQIKNLLFQLVPTYQQIFFCVVTWKICYLHRYFCFFLRQIFVIGIYTSTLQRIMPSTFDVSTFFLHFRGKLVSVFLSF